MNGEAINPGDLAMALYRRRRHKYHSNASTRHHVVDWHELTPATRAQDTQEAVALIAKYPGKTAMQIVDLMTRKGRRRQ